MTDINSRQSIIAMIYIAVIGPCICIVQPAFIQGLVTKLGFDEQQAGDAILSGAETVHGADSNTGSAERRAAA